MAESIITDFTQLLATTDLQPKWVIPRMIETGSQSLLYAKTGVGKSLFALDLGVRVASGLPIFGQHHAPRRTLYLDYENGARALARRLSSMGIKPHETSAIDRSLTYYPFPDMLLDTQQGLALLAQLIDHCNPEFVIIDSLNQSAEGSEQSSDTYVAYQRFTSTLLRQRDIASLRLDNTGKDPQRAARGSSKKSDDVETIWQFTTASTGRNTTVRLMNKKDRLGTAARQLDLTRQDEPILIHELDQDPNPLSEAAQRVAANLDRLGAPRGITVNDARHLLRDNGERQGSNPLAEAVRHRKEADPSPRNAQGNAS